MSARKFDIWPEFSLLGSLSSRSTSTSSVPDSFNQAAATDPVDINLPMLHLATRKGAPTLVRSASTARLKALSPTTLLCLPHPVKMLYRIGHITQVSYQKYDFFEYLKIRK